VTSALSAGAVVAVGLGAAFGAWARWTLSLWLNNSAQSVPLGTLVSNIGGGLLIGIALAWFARHPEIDPVWRLAIVTGFLGALTTFSTFSAESLTLLQRGELGWVFAHSAFHLFGCLAAAALGFRIAS